MGLTLFELPYFLISKNDNFTKTCFIKTRLCAHAYICENILRHECLLHGTTYSYIHTVIEKL